MKKILSYWIFCLAFIVFPTIVSAAVQCNGNATPSLQVGNPACWTVSGSPGYYTYQTINCVWQCGYPLYICGPGGGKYFSTYDNGNRCGRYSSLCYDGCGNGDCQNAGIRNGSSNGTKTISTWHEGSTSYACYYTTVSAWGAPAADGRRVASSVTQRSTSGTGCTSASNVSYVNAQPNLKINGSETAISVNKYNPITISWSSTYATSCSAPAGGSSVGGWTGGKGISGSEPKGVSSAPMPASSTAPATVLNYKISCTNPGGNSIVDTVPVTVTCTPDLNPVWSDCSKNCGDGIQTRTVRHANCYEQTTQRACNNGDCPVSSEWKEVRP